LGTLAPIHWIIILVVVLVVFGGRGKLSGIMGDAAKGVRAFKDGLKGDDHPEESATAKPLAKDAEKG
jgi:sec-independent protein translocase protein TatA